MSTTWLLRSSLQSKIEIAVILGSTFVIELVFNISGIGRLLVKSVLDQDVPVIQGGLIMIEECIFIHVVTLDGIVAYSDKFTGIDKIPAQPLTFDLRKVRWADGN